MINIAIEDEYSVIYELIREGRYQEALSTILNEDGNSCNEKFRDDLNHSYYIVGDILFKVKEYDKAIIFFKKAIGEWSLDNDAKLAILNCLFESHKLSEAISFIEGDILPTKDVRVLYNYGNILADMNLYDKSLSIFKSIKCYDRKLRRSIYKNIRFLRGKLRQ